MNIRTLSTIGVLAVSLACLPVASAAPVAKKLRPHRVLQSTNAVIYPIVIQSQTQTPAYQYAQPVYSVYQTPPVYQYPYNQSFGYRQTWNGYYPSNYYPYYPNNNYGACSTYGLYSVYAGAQSGCTCTNGYVWNAAGTECVPSNAAYNYSNIDTGCYLIDGRHTTYTDPACYCGAGMMWNENRQCVPVTNDYCSRFDSHASYQYDYDSSDHGCYCNAGYRADTSSRSYCVLDVSTGSSASMRDRQLRY